MPKHPGDDGDWCQDSGIVPMPSAREREKQAISLVSPEVRAAMREEERFLAGINGGFNTKRFTDRRLPPDRNNLTPHGPDRPGPSGERKGKML